MDLKAKVLKVDIKKNAGFDEKTGKPHPSYFLEAPVVDTGVDVPVRYQCSFRDSLGADSLYDAYTRNLPEAECDAIAADVLAKAKQRLDNQEVALIVEDVRSNNGFVTILVRI